MDTEEIDSVQCSKSAEELSITCVVFFFFSM